MIKREMASIIKERLRAFPAVAILGPRQAGKTTLARTISKAYYDLEIEEDRLKADLQWNDIIASDKPVVLDEAQNYPEIFPRIRNTIDAARGRKGRFLLLGSVSPGLMKEVSESLAGRIALCELTPFSIAEIDKAKDDELWLKGGYPDGGILGDKNYPVWQNNYLDLLSMRDLPVWGLPAQPPAIHRFFTMLAIGHGNAWNASQTGKSLGVSYHTATSYLNYLEQAFLIRRIYPYHDNLKKRLTKSPKVYWRDSGLLHSLLRLNTFDDLISHPRVGASWEGWVIGQVLDFLNNTGTQYDGPYYLRTNDGYEIDLIISLSGTVYTIEIKLTSSPSQGDMQRLRKTSALIGETTAVLISRTRDHLVSDALISTNPRMFLKYLKKKF
ncbi:MAG TPA: ATP-binding protein [Syntrophorhabdaceae bacterium]|nr:ATP-binding protein [Syntrophorhabdaceae bacterium]